MRIYPELEHSSPKGGVIFHSPGFMLGKGRNFPVLEELAAYQLVGRVMAYQGDDG